MKESDMWAYAVTGIFIFLIVATVYVVVEEESFSVEFCKNATDGPYSLDWGLGHRHIDCKNHKYLINLTEVR